MKRYAVLDSQGKVSNIIVCGSQEIAEQTTSSICVLITEATQEAFVGYGYSEGVFEQPPAEENSSEPS